MARRIFVDAAAEMRRQAATYPSDTPMGQVKADLIALPDALQDAAAAISLWAAKLSPAEQPLDASISDALFSIHQMMFSAQQLATTLQQTVAVKHESELRRMENPRPNEANWDLSRQ